MLLLSYKTLMWNGSAATEHCTNDEDYTVPWLGNRLIFSSSQVVFGLIGIWLNHLVLMELNRVRSQQQMVNAIVSHICYLGITLSLLQFVNATRYLIYYFKFYFNYFWPAALVLVGLKSLAFWENWATLRDRKS